MYGTLFLICLLVNVVGWVISAIGKTHKNFDLFGSITFAVTCSYSFYYSNRSFSQRTQTLMVIIWTLRLGMHLFSRALERGDKRLDKYVEKPIKFLIPFTIQILWVYIMMLPTVAFNQIENPVINNFSYVGWILWLLGFMFESIADYQKRHFLQNESNKGKFIKSGLWSISRHPNYFGEIVLWLGLYIAACSSFETMSQYLTGLSVVFIYYLLRNVSGVNLLEKNGQKRWGQNVEYKKYISTTPILVPFAPIYK